MAREHLIQNLRGQMTRCQSLKQMGRADKKPFFFDSGSMDSMLATNMPGTATGPGCQPVIPTVDYVFRWCGYCIATYY
jgi:hypothetical protein